MSKIAYCGLDLGGTALKYGLISSENNILFSGKKRTGAQKDKTEIISLILESIKELLEKADKMNFAVSAIGLGTPGCVDIEKGKIIGYAPNFKNWGEIELKRIIEEEVKIPAFLDNDANVAAFGEYVLGVGKKFKNLVYITLGTGIGGGIFINGQLLRGSHYCGGEVGHFTIDYNGFTCNCGGLGCWEQYASASALMRFYNVKATKPVDNTYAFFRKVAENEKLALEVLENYYTYLSAGLASFINLFDPEAIIIGGGISESEFFNIEKVKQYTMNKTMFRHPIQFLKAVLGNKTGILGAANFARESLKK